IKGSFGTADRVPMLRAWVNLPRLGVLSTVDFLVDTGADRTVPHPDDAAELKINHRLLGAHATLTGVGGSGSYAAEQALLVLGDGVGLWYLATVIYIATPNASNEGYPSLLGRDVLSRMRMTYDHTNDLLEFDVLSFDHRSEAPAGS
ncbi:MAG: hypothetical protein ACRDG3_03285, partial [Tepidiformaceae bacterium]